MTDHPRRLAYLTYNKEREENFHAEYYATKLKNIGSGKCLSTMTLLAN